MREICDIVTLMEVKRDELDLAQKVDACMVLYQLPRKPTISLSASETTLLPSNTLFHPPAVDYSRRLSTV